MRVEYRNLTWMLLLLLSGKYNNEILFQVCSGEWNNLSITAFVPGALCSQWGVKYQRPDICAVKNSTVVIPCSFYYPDDQNVTRVMWGHGTYTFHGPFIFDSKGNNTLSRFQYVGDEQHDCSLKIHHAQLNDADKYAFRFTTDKEGGKWTGTDGSTLKVVGTFNLFLFHKLHFNLPTLIP